LAETRGFYTLTRADVAMLSGVAPALISYYFGTIIDFHREVMLEAIRTANFRIIAQGLSVGNPHAMGAPLSLKIGAAELLLK
jgi:hypothetical protein